MTTPIDFSRTTYIYINKRHAYVFLWNKLKAFSLSAKSVHFDMVIVFKWIDADLH